MKKTTLPQRNYAINTRNMQLKMDEFFVEKEIPTDDSVRLVNQIVKEMDKEPLKRAYKRTGRKPATNPSTLLKIMIYAAMEGKYSSREVAKECKRDMNYIWLLNGETAPNHSEIARFRSKRLSQCGEEMFYQVVAKLYKYGEIRYAHLFVDGTKIEANANKYSFVWKKSTTKYEQKVDKKLEELTKELNSKYILSDIAREELLKTLEQKHTAPYVHGRGKRKSELQREIEALSELLTRKKKYEGYQETLGSRNSFSKTDPDATFMHMKEDHMRNAQLKPGYNVQLGVEGEYITGISISSERSDQLTLIPLLEDMKTRIKTSYVDMTADAGYESEENYTYFEGQETQCYIKPQNYEKSKTKKYKSNMFLRENMPYDIEKGEYTCPNGKKFKVFSTGKRKSKSGFESEITNYACEDCSGCPHKKSCTRSKGNRKMSVSKKFIRQRAESLERITSPLGIQLRMNRSIQSEGTFGVLKQDRAFRQFLLRGKTKVFTEILLLAMAHNVNKLHNKIQQNRTGSQLFEKLSA